MFCFALQTDIRSLVGFSARFSEAEKLLLLLRFFFFFFLSEKSHRFCTWFFYGPLLPLNKLQFQSNFA